jgi:hypothetical protein
MTTDRLQLIREQARKLKEDANPKPTIPVKQLEEEVQPVPTLPQEYKGSSFLSIAKNNRTNTVQDIVAKFAIQEEVAEQIQVTEEQGKRINKALGRMVTGVAAAVPLICRGDGCSYKESCVTGDTLVLTVNGHKRIDTLEKGQSIFSYNLETKFLEKDTVLAFTPTGIKPIYEVRTKQGNVIKVTSNHQFLTVNSKGEFEWQSLDTGLGVSSTLVVEDMTITYDDDYLETFGDCFEDHIISIVYLGEEEVFDITVQNNQNFVANNIVIHNCPIFKENAHPLGERCPVEISLIEIWAQEYIEDLNIDPNSIIELQTLSRLLEISILERRLTEYMSIHDPDLTADFITSVDQEGNAISNKGPSIAFEQREKLDRAKMKHLESLNATRERKLKVQQQMQQEAKTDTGIQDVRRDVSEVVRLLKKEKEAKIVGEG